MNGHNGQPANYADTEGAPSAVRYDDRLRGGASSRRRPVSGRTPAGTGSSSTDHPRFNLDPRSLLRPARRRWYWLLLGALFGGAAGIAAGLWLWKVEYG